MLHRVQRLLHTLLAGPATSIEADRIEKWWPAQRALERRWELPADRAVVGGFSAPSLGFAFAAGYRAALRALIPQLPAERLVALCATEAGGVHPRAIQTALRPAGTGHHWSLSGQKRWATFGTHADELLVVATTGTDTKGRNRLRVARVDVHLAGVEIKAMPPTPFTPDIPHAEVSLDGVGLDDSDLLEGDGYARYLKPFRTIEDIHVYAAVLAYFVALARRHDWPGEAIEPTVALLISIRTLATADPQDPEVHVALAGAISSARRLEAELGPHLASLPAPLASHWERDRALLDVASGARAARRERAWERLRGQ